MEIKNKINFRMIKMTNKIAFEKAIFSSDYYYRNTYKLNEKHLKYKSLKMMTNSCL